jgi:hypothetical protein
LLHCYFPVVPTVLLPFIFLLLLLTWTIITEAKSHVTATVWCFFWGETEGRETPVQTKFQRTWQLDREPSRSLVGNCMILLLLKSWMVARKFWVMAQLDFTGIRYHVYDRMSHWLLVHCVQWLQVKVTDH